MKMSRKIIKKRWHGTRRLIKSPSVSGSTVYTLISRLLLLMKKMIYDYKFISCRPNIVSKVRC